MTVMQDGTYLEHDGSPAVRFERRYDLPVERVWRAVSDPAEMGHWFPSPDISHDARQGGTITLAGDPYDPGPHTSQIITWDPPHRFSFGWGDDVLHLTVEPEGEGCRLTLLDVLPKEGAAARNAAGWDMCLADLDRGLTGTAKEEFDLEEFRPVLETYKSRGLPDDGWLPDPPA